MIKLHQAGDTIVEVILVLAVLGLAISIAYSTANRSLQATRQAEENSQATALVQAQIETLRSNAALASMDINYIYRDPVTTGGFCFDSSSTIVGLVTLTPTTTSDYTRYDPRCLYNNLFHIAIFYEKTDSLGNINDTFTVRATWDDVMAGQDTVTLTYRLHPKP